MNIRLEYSQLIGAFKQAKPLEQTDSEKGFFIICCIIDDERANRFINEMIRKHPQLNRFQLDGFPTLKEIKIELFQFIKRDIQLLEQEMDKQFRRRSKLFN